MEGDLGVWREQIRGSGNSLGEAGWRVTWTRVATDEMEGNRQMLRI